MNGLEPTAEQILEALQDLPAPSDLRHSNVQRFLVRKPMSGQVFFNDQPAGDLQSIAFELEATRRKVVNERTGTVWFCWTCRDVMWPS
jgi:hypothetical protein